MRSEVQGNEVQANTAFVVRWIRDHEQNWFFLKPGLADSGEEL